MPHELPILTGRGSHANPKNRFERLHVENDFEHFEADEAFAQSLTRVATEYLVDSSRSIIATNDSPDVPFRFSINPHRGCSHGWMCSIIIPHCKFSTPE